MDDEQCAILEKKLRDPRAKPAALTLPFLREITNNFSDERKIGSGGFGEVYKGVFRNEMIAVKKLYTHLLLGKKPSFEDEVIRFMGTAHRNVVRLIGFCSDTQADVREVEGRGYVLAEIRERLICFEFVDRGSLGDAIKAEHEGLEWYKRYGIIKGICEGLQYLHEEKDIVHLDLKPANILLDSNLVPKIADFGLSRLFSKEQTTQVTTTCFATPGYAPPEYIYHSAITLKFDIYSLGVIMQEIITGRKEMECNVENVRTSPSQSPEKSEYL